MALNDIQVVQNQLLTDAIQKDTISGRYVSDQVLTMRQLDANAPFTGTFATIDSVDLNTGDDDRVANGAKFAEVQGFTRSKGTYDIETHGLMQTITDKDIANTTSPFEARREAAMVIAGQLWGIKETNLATPLRTSGNYVTGNTVTLSGDGQFDDAASDPLGVFQTGLDNLLLSTGSVPVAVIPTLVLNRLRFHATLMSDLGFSQNRTGRMSNEELAGALGVAEIIEAGAMGNPNQTGIAAANNFIWGKDIVLVVRTPGPEIMMPTMGYLFQHGQQRQVFADIPTNPPESEEIFVRDRYEFNITNFAAGYLIKDAIS